MTAPNSSCGALARGPANALPVRQLRALLAARVLGTHLKKKKKKKCRNLGLLKPVSVNHSQIVLCVS